MGLLHDLKFTQRLPPAPVEETKAGIEPTEALASAYISHEEIVGRASPPRTRKHTIARPRLRVIHLGVTI